MCVAYLTKLSLKVSLFLVHSKSKGPNTVSFHVKAVEGLRGHLRAPGREASQLGSKLRLPGPQQTLLQLS